MLACPTCGNRYPENFDVCPVDGTPLAPRHEDDPLVGQRLGETYRVERVIGSGGMSKVYVAEHERLGRSYAVKVLRPALASHTEVTSRFLREARTVASLRHPGIVDVVDCAESSDGLHYMVMELLVGESLGALLAREGMLEVGRAIEIAKQTAQALQAAHGAGVVHRDIKPDNIFISRTHDGQEQVKVLDFGIARLAGTVRMTQQGEVLGTPQYSSPEQARGDSELDHRSDIYSLGATLFHAVCGKPPFDAETSVATLIQHLTTPPPPPRSLRPELSRTLEKLILRMLEKSPSNRVQGAAEVIAGLTAVAVGTGPDTGTTGPLVEVVAAGLHEIRVVTALVADIDAKAVGDVESQVTATARAFEVLAEEVQLEGGAVDQLAGNRAFGLFGLSVSFGDEPLRAVRTAYAAHRRCPQGVDLRIAVGTGRALSLSSTNPTGPAASAAARLLERVPFGAVVVDAATYGRVRSAYRGHSVQDVDKEKGAYLLEERVEPIELTTPSGLAFEPEIPTIGRHTQLDSVWTLLNQAIEERRPKVAVVTGEPGVGKSRLKTDLFLKADGTPGLPVSYLEGAAQPFGQEQPFSVLGVILRTRAGLTLDCTEDDALESIRNVLGQSGLTDDIDAHAEILSIVARLGGTPSSSLALLIESSPRRLRERIIESFTALMIGMARVSPFLLCIEDAHCLDRASVEAIAHLVAVQDDLPLFIMMLGRPEAKGRLEGMDEATRIELGALSRPDTHRLLGHMLRADVPEELDEIVWERTEGVPLFVEEMFFALRQRGAVVESGDSWQLSEEVALVDIPPSIEGVVQARLDALDSELKQVLRRASVLGTTVWDDAIAALGTQDIDQSISELTARDVLIPRHRSTIAGCREYGFRSALLRDVAYRMLPSLDRVAFHSSAADWLAEKNAEPAVLGRHLERANRSNEAAAQYLRAGDIASHSFANEESLAYYDRSLELATRREQDPGESWAARLSIDSRFGRETVLTRLGRREEALESISRAEDDALAQGDPKRAAQAMVRRGALVRLVDPRAALEILDGALEKVVDSGDVEWECIASRQLAQAAAFSGDLDRGLQAAEHSVETARSLGAQVLILRALMVFGTIATIRDGHWSGLGPFEEALEIARLVGDIETEADLLQRCGFLRSELGDVERAFADLSAARALCERTGNKRVQTFTVHNLGWVLWKHGRVDEAVEAEREALRLSQEIQLNHVEMGTEIYLALMDLGQKRPKEALERGHRVTGASVSAGYAEPQIHAAMVDALAHLELGDEDRAVDAAQRTVEAYHEHGGTQQFEVELHLVAAAAFDAAGRRDAVRTALDDAHLALTRRLAPIEESTAKRQLIAAVGMGLPEIIRPQRDELLVAATTAKNARSSGPPRGKE